MPAVAIAAAIGVSACGGEDDFENEPRPPETIELTARIDDKAVVVSPKAVGAGPAMITVSNQGGETAVLTLEGPTDLAGDEIPPGGVGSIKGDLAEGDYEVSAGPESGARPGVLTVGSARESSQNELLLP